MSENNKSYRIRTKIGINENSPMEDKYLTVKLTERVDSIDIMSLKIKQENAYKFHAADYGVVVGRAIANGGFGVPNVKVSIFIAASEATINDPIYNAIYPYERTTRKNKDNIRYNLLPDVGEDDCYQVVGTFPNKRLVLDDDNYLEIYDTYYKFTTRTNGAGDYMIFGIPTGTQILHFDADLSDVGVLSQKPRDMIYKGYNEKQFENPNQFKKDDNLANLPQIISQDDSVYIYPFWGDEDENIIGITRHDIDINYKFEPTCVFIGSLVTDTNSNHISKKCIPTPEMGVMEELVTGPGRIEMIRKKQNGDVEQFNVQGTMLINENGVWCYQIPMNLDYVMTDEYGNLVPSNDPTKGIATRAKVRFRFSMDEFENDSLNSFRTKVLVPNNPQNDRYEPDYVFGSFTSDESFRDLLWNNVYTVKSFIPRFQKGNGNNNRRFSGIKQCNYHSQSNPIPYNNMRINLSFMFVVTCLLVRLMIWVVTVYNGFITALSNAISKFVNSSAVKKARSARDWFKTVGGNGLFGYILRGVINFILGPVRLIIGAIAVIGDIFRKIAVSLSCLYIDGSLCDTLEGSWFFAPNCGKKGLATNDPNKFVWKNMMAKIEGKKLEQVDYTSTRSKTGGGMVDKQSIDSSNGDDFSDPENQIKIEYVNDSGQPLTPPSSTTAQYVIARGINYFLQCIEISLAMEFRVIQFDFYNDWINGMVYIPRWERSIKRKRRFFLFGKTRIEIRACNDSYKKRFFERRNYLTEQCGVSYKAKTGDNSIGTPLGCKSNKKYKCHKRPGRKQFRIFNDGGVVHEESTASGLYAYYFRPCEYVTNQNPAKNRKVNLFATDLVLLGSLVDCDINGTPSFINEFTSSSYQIPPPLAMTDSSEEGYTYVARGRDGDLLTDENKQLVGVFDMADSILNQSDDGAVTEESGIDWGYTGPGQGSPNMTKGYLPGGHFLGISCVNSQTITKSCVNLKRVCEAGVWTSQRQEAFNGYDSQRNGQYVDIIPDGLIARDEISGDNFRKVFATMNHNGLKTKVNESRFTVYDFGYMDPENFGGEYLKYAKTGYYNNASPISDEEKYFAKLDDENSYGEKYTNDSEQEEIKVKPIRRSLDERDRDYMRFRLGLDRETNYLIQTKHLGSDDYGYYMPVYNNSFYFYFGLKPGETAIDEFHKQFFAECKHTMTTEDLRLRIELLYSRECCAKKTCKNAFDSPVEISIFKTNTEFDRNTDYLRIYSTSVPIKIVIDSEIEYTIKDYDDPNIRHQEGESIDYSNKVYIDFIGETGTSMFNLGIGKHTVRVTDSEGRTVTNLVEVTQQKVTPCVSVSGAPFTKDAYIIYTAQKLISGEGIDNRDDLGGYFLFDWNNSQCPSGCTSENGIFTYHEVIQGQCEEGGEEKCVKESEVCMLFVGRSHIIRVGGNNWRDDEIANEFPDYTAGDIISGKTSDVYGHCVYAGEEGYYDFYVLYKKDSQNKTIPILIEDDVYIGEPPAIDFDIFRDVIDSEEDSQVTYRNPIVKLWYEYPDFWYRHLYDAKYINELTNTQRWYIRKMLYYVVKGVKNNELPPEEINENFISERTDSNKNPININLFFPDTIFNVDCFVNGAKKQTLNKSSYSAVKLNSKLGPSVGSQYMIKITGATEDNRTVYAPLQQSGGGYFNLNFFYKPFYYEAVVWEGYSYLGTGSTGSYGHVNGSIYNGVVYDIEEDGERKQIFGPILLNDRYNLNNSVEVSVINNDFDETVRVSPINYDAEVGTTLSDGSNSILVTEGSPQDYVESYSPVEYSIETSTIGNASTWVFTLDVVNTGTTRTANLYFEFEDNGYNTVNWYWSKNKPIYGSENINNVIAAIKTTDSTMLKYLYTDGFGSILRGHEKKGSVTMPKLTANGMMSGSVTAGTLLAESVTSDNLIYSDHPTQHDLGFISSRTFIRNDININYSYNPEYLVSVARIGPSTLCLGDDDYIDNWLALKAVRSVQYGPEEEYGGLSLLSLRITIPFNDKQFRDSIGNNLETVIFDIHKEDYSSSVSFDLVNDLGYTPEYRNGFIYFSLSSESPRNEAVFDIDTKVSDLFIDTLSYRYSRNSKYWSNWFAGMTLNYFSDKECNVTFKSNAVSSGKEGKNDIIDNISITLPMTIKFSTGKATDE